VEQSPRFFARESFLRKSIYLNKEPVMTQLEIDSAVASATGETVSEIRHLGFGIADPFQVDYDPEPCRPQVFNWDLGGPADWPGA
jgi:hypothetical protein